ncbi:C45 family autoproteolytic acyltransferase/hydolase [Fictibacillus fluitans]|uniref:C45 family autoproteolytic acyltransferase/hydrolase n=1 Tax=Fictibacillus fluitans TaxID=3058422 RepID=A0ABT8HQF2_9BACL|nr:C45 family peptidase [Fictibacillus sp. NE201]MDN4523002.1 C45 family autoproteolytic acyltransferase/hydrolase [Fictibacillus sp. NE201]
MKEFPYIRVHGSPHERGKRIGEKASNYIIHNIETYKKIFLEMGNVSWSEARKFAEQYIQSIAEYDQEILDEIIGISKGSGQHLLDIMALNTRSEILLNSDGCTSMAVVPKGAKKRETLLAQNWDWNPEINPGVILLEIDQAPRPNILMATEAGIVGKIGLNGEGVGVCLNLLGAKHHTRGVPIHVILRGILNSRSVSQAIGQIARAERGTAANFLIADGEGSAFNVESTGADFDVLFPEEGILCHTNHFTSNRMNVVDTGRVKFPDTYLRLCRSRELLNDRTEKVNTEDIKHILADHHGYPDSICRHGNTVPTDLGRIAASNTVFSIVMNLSSKSLEITYGEPCSAEYVSYSLDERCGNKEKTIS